MKIKRSYLSYAFLLAIFLFVSYLFGFTGLKVFLGFFFAVFLPAYLILKSIDIEEGERIFFSFFIGLAFVPLVVWYIDRIIPTLRVSISVGAVLLIILGIYLIRKKLKSSAS